MITAPLREDVLLTILKCIDDEPEFPDEPPQEFIIAMQKALAENDLRLLLEALRLSVAMTKQGIKERIMAQCGEVVRIQRYAWYHPSGATAQWNITRAIELVKMRTTSKLDILISHADMVGLLARNPLSKDISAEHAATRDLSIPLITTVSPYVAPDEHYPPGAMPVILIDGWHRMKRAVDEGLPSLPAYILTPAEDEACRIY